MDTFLKFIFESKKTLIGAFVLGALFYFGPRYAPGYVPKIQDPWAFGPLAAMALSGLLLLGMALEILPKVTGRAFRRIRLLARSKRLSTREVELLLLLTKQQGYWLDLDAVDDLYRFQTDITLTELEKKGYVDRLFPGSPIFTLTDAGKLRAQTIIESTLLREKERQKGLQSS